MHRVLVTCSRHVSCIGWQLSLQLSIAAIVGIGKLYHNHIFWLQGPQHNTSIDTRLATSAFFVCQRGRRGLISQQSFVPPRRRNSLPLQPGSTAKQDTPSETSEDNAAGKKAFRTMKQTHALVFFSSRHLVPSDVPPPLRREAADSD